MPDQQQLAVAQKRALLAKEKLDAKTLIAEYRRVWERVQVDLKVLTDKIAAARDSGQTVRQVWLYQEARLQSLLEQVQGEIAVTAQILTGQITQAQTDAAATGQQNAADLIRAGLPADIGFTPAFPAAAFHQIVGFAQDGRPLGDFLAELGPAAGEAVKNALLTGVGVGDGPRAIARRVRDALGGNMARALTISRTETLRAYRESSRAVYQANTDVVQDWVWFATLDARTCPVCWAMHGQVFKTDTMMETHPNCRCALIPRTRSWDELGFHDLPDTRPVIPLGEDLFAAADPELQKQVLGPGKFAAYQSGDITLQDLVVKTNSARWGGGRRERSLADISA